MRLRLLSLALLPVLAACSNLRDSSTPTSPVARTQSSARPSGPRYIVMLRDNVAGAASVSKSMASEHASVPDFVYTASIKGFAARLSPQAADALRHDPRVLMVSEEKFYSVDAVETPTPSWGLDRIDQRNLPFDASYTYVRTGRGVHFYGIDTGILTSHSDFAGRTETGFTAFNDGNGTTDCFGHGTHTASTAAGAVYGVAKQMTVVPVRVLDCTGNGGTAEIIAGVDWVTANRVLPAVANMSLGLLGGDEPTDSAVARSIASGVVYVVSAGNKNTSACLYSPAVVPSAITVGATESADFRASFSDYGSCVDLFAPGQGITAAWIGSPTATRTEDGTSMAAPHVAGAAGLYLEAFPTATPAQVANAITSNATPNLILNPGAGSPNLILYTGFIPANIAPVANFTWSCTPRHSCTFDASSSQDADGSIVSYVWAIEKVKKAATGVVLVTDLKGNQARLVTLTVTDNSGATASITRSVQP